MDGSKGSTNDAKGAADGVKAAMDDPKGAMNGPKGAMDEVKGTLLSCIPLFLPHLMTHWLLLSKKTIDCSGEGLYLIEEKLLWKQIFW